MAASPAADASAVEAAASAADAIAVEAALPLNVASCRGIVASALALPHGIAASTAVV